MIRTRITLVCVVSIFISALAMIILVRQSNKNLRARITEDYQQQQTASCEVTADGLQNMVASIDEATAAKLNSDIGSLQDWLERSGGVQTKGGETQWEAVNQLSKEKSQISLAALTIGSAQLSPSMAEDAYAGFDRLKKITGSNFTIFQRMNGRGDMLRVCTTVQTAAGKRAVGTYIPAQSSEGASPLIASILNKQSFLGRALVVGRWNQTIYTPLCDKQGNVTGMLFCGVPQDSVQALRLGIEQTKVGKTGKALAIGTQGADAGVVIVAPADWPQKAKTPFAEGQSAQAQQAFNKLLQDAIQANDSKPHSAHVEWTLDGKTEPRLLTAVYYKPWEWVLLATMPDSDYAENLDRINGMFSRLNAHIMLGAAILLIIMGAVTGIVCRRLLAPLNAIHAHMEEIANGNGDLTRRLPIERQDEIGKLSGSFNQFVSAIQGIIREVVTASQQLSSAAGEIENSSRSIAEGLNTQSSSLEQISSAITEMSCSVSEVAQQTVNVTEQAKFSDNRAQDGSRVVEETLKAMEQLHHSVEAGAENVNQLGQKSEEIGRIVGLINDIADQTNLLALNAAIEAARGGEHGRGFAVVADEVRKLAERTSQATNQIKDVIATIQAQIQQAIDRMRSGTQQAGEAAKSAESTGESLRQIATATNQVTDMVKSVSTAVEQQSAAGEEISQSVSMLSNLIHDEKEQAAQSADIATQLAGQAERLGRLVGQFKS